MKTLTSIRNQVPEWIALGSIVLLGLVLYLPNLRDIFKFTFLHPIDIGICLAVGLGSVLWTEWLPRKWIDANERQR
jgi:hypothetical protein